MDKESGEKIKTRKLIYMKANMLMIKKRDMAFSNGLAVMYIGECTKQMKEKELER